MHFHSFPIQLILTGIDGLGTRWHVADTSLIKLGLHPHQYNQPIGYWFRYGDVPERRTLEFGSNT